MRLNKHHLHIPPRPTDSLRYGRKACGKLFRILCPVPACPVLNAQKHFYDFFIVYHHTASFPASPIYYGFSSEYYIKFQTFSKKLYHTSREIACVSFRCFAGGSPAFLIVWDGQTERDAVFLNVKFPAARFRVCVGLLANRRITAAVCSR